ncbi:hypothetical protein EJ05DRAFT_68239 [Pseudovirgaria hyperparasitica]|uniref:Uncharacterized protein n=1 Tax=Pseudovirgaria hyperparasitica TaxID=470096 RepID=A0A6A6W0Z7_9PEZI|nr:uncharacterized protein EJ05DRAFT_68239 [Pseudovirgaria hyperparasitica]KAF2756572.1 hypothetical protein EJ05DRAFT_68239 [Pseudovirgaria hyperparasitica]
MDQTSGQLNVAVDTVCVSCGEIATEVDEPPDHPPQRTPGPVSSLAAETDKFTKTRPTSSRRQESLLTQALHVSEPETHSEEDPCLQSPKDYSSADLTSDCGFTSCGTRNSSPSPPCPPSMFNILPVFSKLDFNPSQVKIQTDDDHVVPQGQAMPESTLEANLGRKRCITFACGRKASPTPTPTPRVQTPPKMEQTAPVKRGCTIRFACPSKVLAEQPMHLQEKKPKISRAASPAPSLLKQRESIPASPRQHRDSDSTVRNDSPKSVRKVASTNHKRTLSGNSDLGRSEATRFHAFASGKEEDDDWTKEATCHRSRLTVSDTLKIENCLRKLGEEAEEEALQEEQDVDEEDENEDDDDDDEFGGAGANDMDEDSDDGFHTDNEAGFASSDDESDAGSDYDWWAPGPGAGLSTAATSTDHLEHIRPLGRRSFSDSSVGSPDSEVAFLTHHKSSPNRLRRRKRNAININVEPTPELPDSTDFVCGTLDEDRPLEDAYASAIERRRAAKHRTTPQDIDPSFPTSDPELDDDEEETRTGSVSDQHMLMHGAFDSMDEDEPRTARPSKKATTPVRMRSPPPAAMRRTRSPAPIRRAHTGTPPKRMRSPALRPPRRASLIHSPPAVRVSNLHFVGMAERPSMQIAASLPRAPVMNPLSPLDYDDDESNDLPSRGAIDIKAGLEQKRQRRLQKLYQKHCRKQAKEGEKKPSPGKGCERMREIGLEMAAYNKSKRAPINAAPATKDPLMISV